MTKQELLAIANPILFNTEMVRALLGGNKTVTRRVVKKKYDNTDLEMRTDKYGTYLIEVQNDVKPTIIYTDENGKRWNNMPLKAAMDCKPPYKVGDILYVRETWQENPIEIGGGYFYKEEAKEPNNYSWKPSIHMPTQAARIFLRVTDVRVKRLQDITEEQAKAEGVSIDNWTMRGGYGGEDSPYWIEAFAELWDSIIKKADIDRYSWNANPWVFVISFERTIVDA